MKLWSGIASLSCRAKQSSEGQAVGNCVSIGSGLEVRLSEDASNHVRPIQSMVGHFEESRQANSINGRAFEIIASGQFNQWSGIFEVVRSGQAIQWSGIWYFEEKEE